MFSKVLSTFTKLVRANFVVPLTLLAGIIAYIAMPYVDVALRTWASADLSLRSKLVANLVEEIDVTGLSAAEQNVRLLGVLNRATRDERLIAAAICGSEGASMLSTALWPKELGCSGISENSGARIATIANRNVHIDAAAVNLFPGERNPQRLVLVHDMSYASIRSREGVIYAALLLGVLWISTIFVASGVGRWMSYGWRRTLRSALRIENSTDERRQMLERIGFSDVAAHVNTFVDDLERNARAMKTPLLQWDANALRGLQAEHLAGDEVIVVSNRQPYSHVRCGSGIEVVAPASGLVTALEPIVAACKGTWIAHGNGDADREVVNGQDCVSVPPGSPTYLLKRIWLSEREIEEYYGGFANRGLWPLCLTAHVRPVFQQAHWKTYRAVNERFADAVCNEAKTPNPIVLVQDYHFALLPSLLRERLPNATVIMFWHIPWPNPETFGICPWREEILKGLLGSTILGFHTETHCRNFLGAIDRYLEARIEHERSTVFVGGRPSMIRAYPISIDWDASTRYVSSTTTAKAKSEVCRLHSLPPDCKLILGVDRMDYSKGLIERCQAFERFLEDNPAEIGKTYLIQIASPTRESLVEYDQFAQRTTSEVTRINDRFTERRGIEPIVLLHRHHSHKEVQLYLKATQVCLVTSLHDGMNLVAKEFVAVREDHTGVLILSQFAGAIGELPESISVNPYDIAGVAEAISIALRMPKTEQEHRMLSMRKTVSSNNVYAWAGKMILDAHVVRQRDRLEELWNRATSD